MAHLDKNLVEELELGIATGLGAQKTKVGSDGKQEALAFSRPCFRYLLLAFCFVLAGSAAFVLHSNFVITITTREAWQREKHHRSDNHHCAARLIKVENQLEARYERDHHRAMLAKHYHTRSDRAYTELGEKINELASSPSHATVDPEFKHSVIQLVQQHVVTGSLRGRKLFKSIIDDELEAGKNEKALQKSISQDLANESAEADEFSTRHDKHYGQPKEKYDLDGLSTKGSVDGHDHSDEDGEVVVTGEIKKQVQKFFKNLATYRKTHLSNIKITKSDPVYKKLKHGPLKMLKGGFTESQMVSALQNSSADLLKAGLKTYNKAEDGDAADYIFNLIQMLTIHTHEAELIQIEKDFNNGGTSGAQIMTVLVKLQEKGVIPAELFSMDAYSPESEENDPEERAEENPFAKVPVREYGLSDQEGEDDVDSDGEDKVDENNTKNAERLNTIDDSPAVEDDQVADGGQPEDDDESTSTYRARPPVGPQQPDEDERAFNRPPVDARQPQDVDEESTLQYNRPPEEDDQRDDRPPANAGLDEDGQAEDGQPVDNDSRSIMNDQQQEDDGEPPVEDDEKEVGGDWQPPQKTVQKKQQQQPGAEKQQGVAETQQRVAESQQGVAEKQQQQQRVPERKQPVAETQQPVAESQQGVAEKQQQQRVPERKQPVAETQQPVAESQQGVAEKQQQRVPELQRKQPVPEKQQQSVPETQQPVPEKQQQSVPEKQQPVPEKQQPVPEKQQPVPEKQQPVPEKQ